MIIKIIIAMTVGAAIGYITNDLAIKMLFRPRIPQFIGRWKLPFTPGLIPKEKERLAKSIAKTISENLLSSEVLSKNLNSEEMKAKLLSWLDNFFIEQSHNNSTVRETISTILGVEQTEKSIAGIKAQVIDFIVDSIQKKEVSEKLADALLEGINKKMRANFFGDIFGGVIDGVGAIFSVATRNILIKNLNILFADNANELVSNLIDKEGDNLLNMRICDIVEKNSKSLPKIKESVLRIYGNIIQSDLPKILKTVDISSIVENRINEFDPTMLESLILGVARKELKAIVWLGALLGAIMGVMNVVINFVIS